MHELPTDWGALCVLVFLLGMRHGFDADHLAAIDGLTRLNARDGRGFARYCGALFSLGHGLVVMTIAGSIGLLSARWSPPSWLDALGAWISIGFLILIGATNLHAVVTTAPDRVVALVGVKGSLFGRLVRARSPLGVLAVGALFAISFDTVSQSALFAATAVPFGGISRALMLGTLFVLGMLATDGLNGWWISRLITRADQLAAMASRIMSVAVSVVSLFVAGLGIARLLWPAVDDWSEHRDLLFGAVVLLLIALSYACARWIGRYAVRGGSAQGEPA